MKVCTDSCIFGAWATPGDELKKIEALDIGAGTGLLSLMLAQRFENIVIDAVEIDAAAAKQAGENFLHSPWANRLNVFCDDIENFTATQKYDFIICNPPFFHNNLKSPEAKKNKAKHVQTLDEMMLLHIIEHHLKNEGSFALMLSFERREICIKAAGKFGWFPVKELWVKQTPAHDYFRAMIQFEKKLQQTCIQTMCIKDAANLYTNEYDALMSNFLR